MSSSKRRKPRGREGFHSFYREIYGPRWESLADACLQSPEQMEMSEGLLSPYYLDTASYAAARSLGAEPGEEILDMCAAPGGKTLVLALELRGEGLLVANERSSARRARLRHVLENHLPPRLGSIIQITPHDAAKWGLHEQNRYDRVLLDIPCSSERHLLNSPKHLDRWTESRTEQLARQAYAMLAAAAAAVRPGGLILYATCALSPEENDGVIERLLQKKRHPLLPETMEEAFFFSKFNLIGEKTARGIHFLPDRAGGAGPLYMAKLRKC